MLNKISFPALGLTFNVSKTALQIGPFTVMWYAVMILCGLILGTLFCCATAKKRGVDPDNLTDIVLYGLIFGIIGARLYYVIFDFDEYRASMAEVFKIWEGGLAIYGGLIGAFLSTFVYCRKKKLVTLKIMDASAPGLLIGQAIGRFGNFFNAEVYGVETRLPWGMSINGGASVHPLFLYEALWNILGLILMILLRDKKKAEGQVIAGYVFWYSLGRFFLEGLRQKQYILWLVHDKIAVSQAFAAVLVIASALAFVWLTKNGRLSASAKIQVSDDERADASELSPAENEDIPKASENTSCAADSKDGNNASATGQDIGSSDSDAYVSDDTDTGSGTEDILIDRTDSNE